MWPRIEGHSAPPLPPAAIDRIVKQIFRRPSPVLFGGQQNGPLSAHDRYSESNSTNQRGYLVAGGVSILSAYLIKMSPMARIISPRICMAAFLLRPAPAPILPPPIIFSIIPPPTIHTAR